MKFLLIALTTTLFLTQIESLHAAYRPGILEENEIPQKYDPKALKYFTNTKQFMNQEQSRWLSTASVMFTALTQELGIARDTDEQIKKRYKSLIKLIPNLPPLTNHIGLKQFITSGFSGSTNPEKMPFFAKKRLAKDWICIVTEKGRCEMLQLEARKLDFIKINILHRPDSFFSNPMPNNSWINQTSEIFESYYPGDILKFSGYISGIQFDKTAGMWLKPQFIIVDSIDSITLMDNDLYISISTGGDFQLLTQAPTKESIFSEFDQTISSDSKDFRRKGINIDGASLIVNSSNFINPKQTKILNTFVQNISILLQPESKSRGLDEARKTSHRILSEKIPELLDLDAPKKNNGTYNPGLINQILDNRKGYGLPFFEKDQALENWVCIVTTQKPKGHCSMLFFAKNGHKIFETKVILWDRISKSNDKNNYSRRIYNAFSDFYPGEIISFKGTMFGLEFDQLHKYEDFYYPKTIFFSEISDPKLLELPFTLKSFNEYSLETKPKSFREQEDER